MYRGDSTLSNLAYGVGTIVPEMILPAGQIKLGAGIAGNALRGAGFGALGGGLTSLLDSDQSWQQALGGAALGAGAGGLLGAAGASVLGHFNGYGWGNSPKAGLLNSTIDDAGNIKVDPIVGATNADDDAIARAMNAQRTQPRWQTTEQMPQQMVGQPHWYPNAQTQASMDNVHINPNAENVQMSVKPPKEQNAIQQISAAEEAQLRKEFIFKDNKPLQRELTSDAIAHALKQHGNPEIESRRGQIAITLDDIREHYPAITQNYDYRAPTNNNAIIYVKQINGHFITIEEVIQNGKLRFKTAWKTKGNFNQQQVFRNAQYIENRSQIGNPRPADITATQAEYSSKTTPETLADNANPTTSPLNNPLENAQNSMNPTRSLATPASQARNDTIGAQNGNAHTFARNLAQNLATNALAGTAGGIANVALDDSDDALAKKFAKGFALGVAGKVAAKHGMPAGARASKAAFDYAMQKSAQFSTLLRENPQLFTRLLNKQLTDDFAQFGGQSSGLHAERFAIAKELAQKGASEEEILARTGWFRGLDGNWKFQLDLAKGAAYKLKEGSYHLSQLFKQESLYAAYPFLRDVRVEIARLPEHVNGSFEPTTRIITLNSANNKLDFTKALCHELQHIIQKHEGFAQGSSPKNPNYWTNAGEVEARATFKGGEQNALRRLANERKEGEIIEAMNRASDSEIPNSSTLAHSQKLESAYLKDTHRIDTEALDRHAMALPKALDEQQFMAQAKTDSQGIARVETPIGEINVHMKGAWNHMNRGNTYQKDRNYSSGALFDTLTDPLFVVKQKYIDRAKLSANAKENANSKLVHPKDNESIPQDSYIFFKPYKDSNGAKYLAAFALDIHGNLTNTTFFSPNMSKIRQWIQSHDDDLLYYKYDNQQDKVYSIAGQRAQTDKDTQRIKLEKQALEKRIAEYNNKINALERKINSADDMARKNRDKNISEQERYKSLLFQTKKKYYHIPDQEASKMDFFKSLSERQKADFLNDLERLTHKSDVDSNGIQAVISQVNFWKGKYRDFADESQHHIEMAQRNMILLKELTRLPLESQRELAEKWNATQMRANIEKTFNTQPLKEFGTNYAEYMRDGEGAIHKLRSEKQGQVSGAFYREDLEKISGNGNIDLVWGDETIGLRKIIEKHGDDFSTFGEGEQGIVNGICEIVEKGKIVSNANVRTIIYNFEGKEYRIGLSRGWKGEGDNEWVITAYERKSPSAQNFDQAATQEAGNGNNLSQKSFSNPTTQTIKNNLENDVQYSLKSPLESLKSAQGRLDGLRAFAKYLANPPAHLRGDVQRLRADSAAMRELDMHTRKAATDKANAIDALAYQNGYPEPQYSLKNPRQKQKFAEDSVGILQQIRAKSREGRAQICVAPRLYAKRTREDGRD